MKNRSQKKCKETPVLHFVTKRVAMIQKRSVMLICMVGCLVLSSCSSPEKDGVKAAKMGCNCKSDYNKNLEKAYKSYIKNFDSYSFKTRSEVGEKLLEILQKVEDDFTISIGKANVYRYDLQSKYQTNREKVEKFQFAYFNYDCSPYQVDNDAYKKKIYDKMLATIARPPKPDIERIKNDLRGCHFSHADRYGGRTSTYVPDTQNSIHSLEILEVTDNGDQYVLEISLVLSYRWGPSDECRAKLIYELGTCDDDWVLTSTWGNDGRNNSIKNFLK